MASWRSRAGLFFAELKRRRVYRVGALYLGGAFVILQGADLVVNALVVPAWLYPALVLAAIFGFPVALVLAWVFEITPEGIKRTRGPEGGGATQGLSTGELALRAVLAIAVLAVAAYGGRAAWNAQVSARSRVAPTTADPVLHEGLDPLRLAVLYLDDHTPGRELGYLADGLSEELSHDLAQVTALRLISRNAVRAARDGQISVDSLVRALRVGTYVEGSVVRSGEQVRVNVQLVDASTGEQLSAHRLERPLGELLSLRDSLALEISESLRRQLGIEIRRRAERSRARDAEAWTLVQRADRLSEDIPRTWAREPAAVPAALDRADSLLARSERLDAAWIEPTLRRAWLGRTRARYLAEVPGSATEPALRAALAHAERAMSRAPADPAVLEARGTLRADLARALGGGAERDSLVAGAETDLRAALRDAPDLARAWWVLSELVRQRGDLVESVQLAERALREDAFLAEAQDVVYQLYQTTFEIEDHARARTWCTEGRRRFPDRPNFILCQLLFIASVDSPPLDIARARRLADTVVLIAPQSDQPAWRAYTDMQLAKVFARAGRPDSAETLIARAHGETFQAWLGYDEAHARLLLGQPGRALELLSGYLERRPDRREYWGRDWWLRDLWDDARFKQMLSRPPG